MDPPPHPYISEPIEDMLAQINTAREHLEGNTSRAISALKDAMKSVPGNNTPREWELMLSKAYLLLNPKERYHYFSALSIARELIWKNNGDADALFLAGQACYGLKNYEAAVTYFRKANCYDPGRPEIVGWLNKSKVHGAVV
ncbi:hypothetical protein GGI35DRAFT_465186 [Trichoderma velutinum]